MSNYTIITPVKPTTQPTSLDIPSMAGIPFPMPRKSHNESSAIREKEAIKQLSKNNYT